MEVNYKQVAGEFPEKKQGEIRMGIICSESNPPSNIEFLRALSAINAYLIDRIVYAVTDGIHKNQLLLETKKHRYAMAKMAAKPYEPFITFSDFGDMKGEPISKIRMQNGVERYKVDGEDYAFKIFMHNPTLRFTLFYIEEDKHFTCFDKNGNDDTIKKLLSNLKEKYYGFNPDLHKIVALFVGRGNVPPNPKLILDKQEKSLFDNGVFRIEWMEDTYKEVGIKEDIPAALRDALVGNKPENYFLLPHDIYDYIQKNPDYKEKLILPLRTFEGYLKQHAHESLTPLEQEFFELLFPRFAGVSAASDFEDQVFTFNKEILNDKKLNDLIDSNLKNCFNDRLGKRRDRRFAGINFPRSRYYSIYNDRSGHDDQTLAHELRAYRNPVYLGMVEVIDLANECNLMIRGQQIRLEPANAIGVLIHNYQEIPHRFRVLNFQQLPGFKDTPLYLYRFPYKVEYHTIENVIDLRFPEVREWFFQTFRIQTPSIPEWDYTTAYSRFHFENKRPPQPKDFWEMLPTMINSDLGGGNPGSTGSTLLYIGNWLRKNGVAALIYPSARADVKLIFNKGILNNFIGWNLVHYANAPICNPISEISIDLITIDPNPWAWVEFPEGVRLIKAKKDSEHAGTFVIEGMVDYCAKDYLLQLEALEIARRIHGRESKSGVPAVPTNSRVFMIGVLCVRWLRLVIQNLLRSKQEMSGKEIHEAVLELIGLALPYGLYDNTGRILELWAKLRKTGFAKTDRLIEECIGVLQRVKKTLSCHEQNNFPELLLIGYDLEFTLYSLIARQKNATGSDSLRKYVNDAIRDLSQIPALNQPICNQISIFCELAAKSFEQDVRLNQDVLEDGINLIDVVYQHLKSNEK